MRAKSADEGVPERSSCARVSSGVPDCLQPRRHASVWSPTIPGPLPAEKSSSSSPGPWPGQAHRTAALSLTNKKATNRLSHPASKSNGASSTAASVRPSAKRRASSPDAGQPGWHQFLQVNPLLIPLWRGGKDDFVPASRRSIDRPAQRPAAHERATGRLFVAGSRSTSWAARSGVQHAGRPCGELPGHEALAAGTPPSRRRSSAWCVSLEGFFCGLLLSRKRLRKRLSHSVGNASVAFHEAPNTRNATEGVPYRRCMSAQLGPCFTSTFNGTRSAWALVISRLTRSASRSHSSGGASKTSSSWTLQQHPRPNALAPGQPPVDGHHRLLDSDRREP